MTRRVLLLTVLFVGIFTTVACSDATQSTDPTTEKQSLTNDSFVDGNGWTWHKVGEIDSYSESPSSLLKGEQNAQEGQTVDNMTVEEVANKFQPILEFNQDVYELSEEDTLEMAEQLKAAGGNGITRTDPKLPSAGVLSQSGTSSGGTNSSLAPLAPTASGTNSIRGKNGGLVFGGDERTAVPSDNFPDMMVGNSTRDDSPECSAFKFMGKHMAATAAHCVYEAGLDGGSRNWKSPAGYRFSPDDTIPGIDRVSSDCIARIIPRGWMVDDASPTADYAIILFKHPLQQLEGKYCDVSKYEVGYYGSGVMEPKYGNQTHQVGGYPYPTPFWTDYPDYYVDQDDARVRFIWPNRLLFKIDSTDGQSGGPVTINKPTRKIDGTVYGNIYVTSIVSGHGFLPFARRNEGPRFSDALIQWFKFWKIMSILPQPPQ